MKECLSNLSMNKVLITLFLINVCISLAASCMCSYCTSRGRSFSDHDSSVARMGYQLVPCCPQCRGDGDVSNAVNNFCGVKYLKSTKRSDKASEKRSQKKKSKKNKKKGRNNQRSSERFVLEVDGKNVTLNNEDIVYDTRIVGGQNADINEYPWYVGIYEERDPETIKCGGSIIATRWVITAAHCAFLNEVGVILGKHYTWKNRGKYIRRILVEETFSHPNYGPNGLGARNDVALFKLEQEVDLSVYTPICLPSPDYQNYVSKTAWVIGWGQLADNGGYPNVLQEVEVPIVSENECKTNFATIPNSPTQIEPGMICAAGDGKDACRADSGGPLSMEFGQNKRHSIVGIVSFGYGCAEERYPGVYADVFFYRSWIMCTLAENGGAKFLP